MSSGTVQPRGSSSPDETDIHALYRRMLGCWNRRNAAEIAEDV